MVCGGVPTGEALEASNQPHTHKSSDFFMRHGATAYLTISKTFSASILAPLFD